MTIPNSVQCDEARPNCLRCTGFGFTCNFNPEIPDLQMCCDVAVPMKAGLERAPNLVRPTIQTALRRVEVPAFLYPPVDSTFRINMEHLDRFARFHSRTVLTVGSLESAALFQRTTPELALSVKPPID
jgi:hypothetical protein